MPSVMSLAPSNSSCCSAPMSCRCLHSWPSHWAAARSSLLTALLLLVLFLFLILILPLPPPCRLLLPPSSRELAAEMPQRRRPRDLLLNRVSIVLLSSREHNCSPPCCWTRRMARGGEDSSSCGLCLGAGRGIIGSGCDDVVPMVLRSEQQWQSKGHRRCRCRCRCRLATSVWSGLRAIARTSGRVDLPSLPTGTSALCKLELLSGVSTLHRFTASPCSLALCWLYIYAGRVLGGNSGTS